MVAQGIWWSGYDLFPFVLAKSLAAPGWLITVSVILESMAMLLALYWGQLMARGGRRRWLIRGGVGGRLILLAAPLAGTAMQFLLLLSVVYFFMALVYPAQNGILQANIRPARHGRVFGLGALVQYSTAAATSLAVGAVLDRDPGLYRWVYPVLGTVGFLYPVALARLPRPAGDATPDPAPGPQNVFVVPRLPLGAVQWRRLAGAALAPFREAVAIFGADRKFLWFEVNFMIYGVAYLMLIPVMPLFFTRELDLSYRQISMARVLIASLGMAALGPSMGRLMDRIHPARLCTLSFAILVFFPLALSVGPALAPGSPALTAYAAFAFYAAAMAGINVTWNVGSISFAPAGRGANYQGIHVAMVGVRGLLGPLLGYLLLAAADYQSVFLAAAAVFAVSAASSYALGRSLRSG